MKPTSFLLFLSLTVSALSVRSSTFATDSNAADTTASSAEAELDAKLARLWADRPEYVALLRLKETSDRPPRVVSTVPPENPKSLRRAGIKGTVVVSFFLDKRGRVEAARVVESPDSRVDEPSVAAIMKWKFLPAMRGGKPVKTSVIVPMVWE